ncbi:MAG TPA: choice-of-anchor tandem repeat GloVer-containing protein [Candidatus Limnocylindrales bacterium]|nr:choice-of-anchor tandem repeat GloVer-containing protein [Candidatus Limnocylindrales bacterium]
MKNHIKNRFLLPALIAGFSLMLAGQVTAQTFKTLHGFTAIGPTGNNSDGANPYASLVLSGNTLYGVAASGGANAAGTLFAVDASGSGFTNLHNFSAFSAPYYSGGTNSDGAYPATSLVLSGTTLYGITDLGGGSDDGTMFGINTDGTGFNVLYSFSGYANDQNLREGLILSGTTLYGTTPCSGVNWQGILFSANTDGTGFKTLHVFYDLALNQGSNPHSGLVLSSNIVYGESWGDYTGGGGIIYSASTDGSTFTVLRKFDAATDAYAQYTANSGGAEPSGGLVLSGNTLYGTAIYGGSATNGTVFSMNTDGSGFATLHNFSGASDGAFPTTSLTLSGTTLYGTTSEGGSSGNGTVFKINTDGTGFTTLYSFTATTLPEAGGYNNDGATPMGSLVLAGNTLYGTTSAGGTGGGGTVFSLSLQSASAAPPLTLIRSATNVILTWPTNYTGFTLQSTTNLSLAVWIINTPPPVVVNANNVVTNIISGNRKFYRLTQ